MGVEASITIETEPSCAIRNWHHSNRKDVAIVRVMVFFIIRPNSSSVRRLVTSGISFHLDLKLLGRRGLHQVLYEIIPTPSHDIIAVAAIAVAGIGE